MRKVPLLLQTMHHECGLACLAMVVGRYVKRVDLTTLRRRFPGYAQGLTLKDLAGFAAELGFLTRGLRRSLSSCTSYAHRLCCTGT